MEERRERERGREAVPSHAPPLQSWLDQTYRAKVIRILRHLRQDIARTKVQNPQFGKRVGVFHIERSHLPDTHPR